MQQLREVDLVVVIYNSTEPRSTQADSRFADVCVLQEPTFDHLFFVNIPLTRRRLEEVLHPYETSETVGGKHNRTNLLADTNSKGHPLSPPGRGSLVGTSRRRSNAQTLQLRNIAFQHT